MEQASMIGIDTAKYVFEVHGRNDRGDVVLRRRLRRPQVEKFFAGHAKAVIGLEACGSAHHWARLLGKLGHEVRLLAPAYVKPYVKRNKTDAHDAAACCEAMSRPGMRFVRVKTIDQQAALSLHRSRELLVRQRTQLSNAFRAVLAEFGIVAAKGREGLARLAMELRAGTLDLPEPACLAALALADQRANLEPAIEALERTIVEQAKNDPRARLLQTAPGVGPLSAHAVLATAPDPLAFATSRDFAAWLGLTPREHSTGGKRRTGAITKQGDQTLRRLLVLGATAWLRQVERRPEKASPWLRGMAARDDGAATQEGRRRRPGRPHRPHCVGDAPPRPTLSRAGRRLTRQPYRAPAAG